MVLVHVSALVAAQGPARMRVDRAQVARLLCARRSALARGRRGVGARRCSLADLPDGRLVYAGGLVLLAVTALLATWLLGVRRDRL